ncbi:MAG: transcriptional repressor LexA [Acidobacteria bacterium]|nr:transcriptional repressor LexA [Acidobacteriota bacterium]
MSPTRRQSEVLDFIAAFLRKRGYSPSLEEIGRGTGIASVNAVHKHVKALEREGLVRRSPHAARSVEPVGPPAEEGVELPLLGVIAAGVPLEAVENPEVLRVPADFVGRGTHFVLRVKGDSMIGECIADGDFVIVRETPSVENGEMAVVLVDGENVTLKRLYREPGGMVRLQPSNPAMEAFRFPGERVRVRGVVVGVLRKYR